MSTICEKCGITRTSSGEGKPVNCGCEWSERDRLAYLEWLRQRTEPEARNG